MIYALLFIEFFKIGLFSFGGGYATIPFLYHISQVHNWYTIQDLTQMYSGQSYDLQVYVVPISQYGTTYQRYATKRENNVLVPAYTRIDLDGLVKN